ncbi:hypothetical protein R3X27_00495 [Tropicimonas sp. TH_r6]|uniref:hypothetical protein n=1 Tax=Tropicimonas sp. TH_r6 TaxID=3082085 RepID=UPI002953AA51|nr:hypothetical protein [Tropicimonas sp. TH_r6]MDV7141149.1 hypothetical protein [Tropicimonas sp. TH_r6]
MMRTAGEPRALAQLTAALAGGSLPRTAQQMGERVLERLTSPVRIAVLGRPEAAPAALVNALLGRKVLLESLNMPPMELRFGTGMEVEIVSGSGREQSVAQAEFERIDPLTLALARLSAPLPMLEKVSFLVVELEGETSELDSAIGWAARRADMAIWVAEVLQERERAWWRRLPEGLLDHAFLVATAQAKPMEAVGGTSFGGRFRGAHLTGPGPGWAARMDGFRSELLDHVSNARREDLEGALALLERYHEVQQTPDEALPEEAPDFSDLLDPVPSERGADGATRSGPTAEIVTFLAAQACELSALCDSPNAEAMERAAPAILELCSESIEACGEMAASVGGPVAEVLEEACNLILLMQIEATPEAMGDAVSLMTQIRHECEALLCA